LIHSALCHDLNDDADHWNGWLASRQLFHLPPHQHHATYHHAHKQGKAAHTVDVMTFTAQIDERSSSSPLLLSLPNTLNLTSLTPSWSTHPALNRIIHLQCGVMMMDECVTEEEGMGWMGKQAADDGSEDQHQPEQANWKQLQHDQPCFMPMVAMDSNGAGVAFTSTGSLHRVSAASVLVFLPLSSSSSASDPTHSHHLAWPHAHHSYWTQQCYMTIGREEEMAETMEDESVSSVLDWVDSSGQPLDHPMHIMPFERRSIELNSAAMDSHPSPVASIWSSPSTPTVLSSIYHHFQLALSGRVPPTEPDLSISSNTTVKKDVDGSGEGSGSASFLETETQLSSDADVTVGSTLRAKILAQELADTNELYRLMGQLSDATRTGASATIVWELIIRPCINILKKILLMALKQLLASTLIKILKELITSTINPLQPPADDSTYDQPPADAVDAGEAPPDPPVEDPPIPPTGPGTELLTDATAFLSVSHILGSKGIVDPLLGFLVPVLHNTITQSVHNLAQTGMTKSINIHTIGPMKTQILAGVHIETTKLLTDLLTRQLTDHVSTHLIMLLPHTLTKLCTQSVTRALNRPLTYALSETLTLSLTRSPQQDDECQACTNVGTTCQACAISLANDYYVDYYTSYYAKYFEKYYTFEYSEWYGKLFANDQIRTLA